VADDFGFHIDHHGSLVRPPELLTARESGDRAAIHEAEELAVAAIVQVQRRLSMSAVTDGQFRRDVFESVVYDNVDGFGPAITDHPLADLAGIPAERRRSLGADPSARGRLAQAEATSVLTATQRPVFVALPSPGYLAVQGTGTDAAGLELATAAGAALAAIISAEISALAAQGVGYVALLNPLYTPLLTVAGREQLDALGIDPDATLRAMNAIDEQVPAAVVADEGFRVGLDLSDAGPLPTTELGWHESVAEAFFNSTSFHRVCVDYPNDERARIPLKLVRPGLVVSLGVIDVTAPEVEKVDDLLNVCDPVVDLRGTDDIAFSTNGGFAQSANAGILTADVETAKLRLVETIARYYWGNEI
jgi:methionine synthase II (cobalamin-independent)